MNTAENQATLAIKISQIETLPPFPLLSNIIKAFASAESEGEIRPLIDNIEAEPSILAKVIGVANSAAFGTPVPVRSIKDAVMKLGVIQLKSLVFSIIITTRFNPKKCASFQISRFWKDTMLLAHCAGLMAKYCKNTLYNRNEIHSIALILRIGLLALINVAPNEMEKLLRSERDEDLDLVGAERCALSGIDHYSSGSILLSHWNLPHDFCEIVAQFKQASYSGKYLNTVLLLRRSQQLIDTDFKSETPDIDNTLALTKENIETVEAIYNNDKNWIESFAKLL